MLWGPDKITGLMDDEDFHCEGQILGMEAQSEALCKCDKGR